MSNMSVSCNLSSTKGLDWDFTKKYANIATFRNGNDSDFDNLEFIRA